MKIRPLRCFISYSSKEKARAGNLKGILEELSIQSFLAHEDINVSEEWRKAILAELKKIDIFVALLSESFKVSEWAPQELGIACFLRKALIIPLRLDDTIPFGFASHLQGKPINSDPDIKKHLIGPIIRKFPGNTIPFFIQNLEAVNTFRDAEELLEFMDGYYSLFNTYNANKFMDAAIRNNQIWGAWLCRSKYLPRFIKIHRKKLNRRKLKALEYQINENKPYEWSLASKGNIPKSPT